MRRSAEDLFLEGPAGRLEALLEKQATRTPIGCAVICHPHPLHGGTLQNKVVHTLARAFLNQGYDVLRFNFRGAGQSDGRYDEGRGELQDALAVISWMRKTYPGIPLWLAGFSFGASIAVQAAPPARAAGLVSIAPAVSRLAGKLDEQPDCPWLIVQGDQDELVDIDQTVDWINGLAPGPELAVFPDTSHFFHGKLVRLRQAVEEFVKANPYKTVS